MLDLPEGVPQKRPAVTVRKHIPVIEHIYPKLPIPDQTSGKGLLDYAPRRHRSNLRTLKLEEVFQNLPGEFDCVLESLNDALPLEVVQNIGAPLEGRVQERERSRVVLEALAIANVRSFHRMDGTAEKTTAKELRCFAARRASRNLPNREEERSGAPIEATQSCLNKPARRQSRHAPEPGTPQVSSLSSV